MPTTRILHAADIHLDSPLHGLQRYEGAPVDRLRGATRAAFDELARYVRDEGVDLLLLAGDLFDGDWRDYNSGLYLVRTLGDLGVPVVIVDGNHDAQSQIGKRLRLPEGVRRLAADGPETVVYDGLGVAVHGQSFARRSVSENLAAGYPDPLPGLLNVGLLHTSLDGRPGHDAYAPCTLDDLRAKDYGYWALGHVHAREVVCEDPWVVFPGNLQGRHARETGARGATLVTAADGRVTGVEPVTLDVLRWAACDVDAAGCADGDAVMAEVRSALEAAIDDADGRPVAARVTVTGATDAHAALAADPERWRNEVLAEAGDVGDVWVEKVRLRTGPAVDLDALRARDDALGGLVRALLAVDGAPDVDPAALLGGDLDALRKKLPDGLEDEALAEALADVPALVIGRLLADGA